MQFISIQVPQSWPLRLTVALSGIGFTDEATGEIATLVGLTAATGLPVATAAAVQPLSTLLCPRSPVYAKDPTVSRMRSMGVSEGLRAELLTLTSSGSVRLAHWRARRHDVSAELYAWLNREYARLGPYRRGREGEREQHALTRRAALPLRSAD